MAASLTGTPGRLKLNVISYKMGLQTQTQSVQTRTTLQHVPIRATQDSFRFTVQFRSQRALKVWQDYVRSHHLDCINGTTPTLKFAWPSMDIYLEGVIPTTAGGATRFQPAPQVEVEMLLTRDLLFTPTTDWSKGTDPSEVWNSTDLPEDNVFGDPQ